MAERKIMGARKGKKKIINKIAVLFISFSLAVVPLFEVLAVSDENVPLTVEDEDILDNPAIRTEPEAEEASPEAEEPGDIESESPVQETEDSGEQDLSETEGQQGVLEDGAGEPVQEEEIEDTPVQEGDGYVPGEIIVVYDDVGVSAKKSEHIQEELEKNLEEKEIIVDEIISEADGTQGTVVTAEIADDMSVKEAVAKAQEEENVAYAQPNYIYTRTGDVKQNVYLLSENGSKIEKGSGSEASDTNMSPLHTTNDAAVKSGLTYYLDNANINAAWDIKRCSGTQTVAVLDTGCRYDHADLKNNILSSLAYDVVNEKYLLETSASGADPDGHGTHVCGLVAAQADNGVGIAGSSYNAKILPIDVFDSSGNSSTAYIQKAFRYIKDSIDNGQVSNLHVVNMSLGGYQQDSVIHGEIQDLRSRYNILCVCAGGNDGVSRPCYPSDYDECLSVAWHGIYQGRDCFTDATDLNAYKDVTALGYNIYSTYRSSSTAYCSMSGSSMAAPIVSGVCALLWSYNPSLSASQVYSAIKYGSRGVVSYGGYSLPKLDALGSLLYIGGIASLSRASVSVSGSCVYTGNDVYPAVSVVYGASILVNGADYVVSYYNNRNIGIGSLQITGIGRFSGTLGASFTIVPKGTSISSLSKKKKGFKVKWKKQKTATTGYEIQYSLDPNFIGAKTATIKKNKTTSKSISKLKKKRYYYVRVRTYKKTGGRNYYSEWSAVRQVKTK